MDDVWKWWILMADDVRDLTVAWAPGKYPSLVPRLMHVNFDIGEYANAWTRTAQMFLCLFFTDKGSVLSEPTRGTNFMRLLRTGFIQTDMMLKAQFEFAMQDILEYLNQLEYYETTDPEDQLADAKLLNWSIKVGHALLRVDLISGTGKSYRYELPLSWKS